MNVEILRAAGIDYDKGLRRFMGDEELYKAVLNTFLTDDTLKKAEQAYADRNYQLLFESVHTIKGIAGNTDMTELYRISSELTELVRSCSAPDEETVARCLADMGMVYVRVKQGIIESQEG